MARRRKNEKRQKSIRYFDYSLLFLIIFLLCFGLIMLYSTSSYYGSTRFNDAAYYVKRQMYASALGIVAMLFISRIPYKFWMQLSTLAYFVALVLCTAVIFVGTSAKGQSRWLRIGPIQFQPSEIAKIAVIIFLATIIYKTPKRIGEIMSLLKIMLLISPVLAVVAYNNLSTAIIILGIAVCMLFVASPKYLQFILMGIGVCLFGAFTELCYNFLVAGKLDVSAHKYIRHPQYGIEPVNRQQQKAKRLPKVVAPPDMRFLMLHHIAHILFTEVGGNI